LPFFHKTLFTELNRDILREPYSFRIDHRKSHESSRGFLNTESLYESLKKKDICHYSTSNRELSRPFNFYRLKDKFFCKNNKVAHCHPCSTSPFYCCDIKNIY